MSKFWNSLPPEAQVVGLCLAASAAFALVGLAVYLLVSKPLANAVTLDEQEHGR